MKGLVLFAICIVAVVFVGISLAGRDPIGAEVTQANADMTFGNTVVADVQQAFDVVIKYIFGSIFAGVGVAVFVEARKNYRRWFLDQNKRRWKSGPNANWQGQSAQPRTPNFSKNDLWTMLALLGGGQAKPQDVRARIDVKSAGRTESDEELDIEL